MINPADMFRIKKDWDTFVRNHPKFPLFLNAVKNTPIEAGSVIELNITTADGRNLCSNVKLTQSDLDMIEDLKKMGQK